MANNRPPYLRTIEGRPADASQSVDALLGELIVRYRTERGLNQAQLAQWLGLTVGQLEAYETGAARLPASTLHALAQALGVGAGAFFR